jgi:Resolvase, N terminal domain/Helix-turn-helix domain of resolvase
MRRTFTDLACPEFFHRKSWPRGVSAEGPITEAFRRNLAGALSPAEGRLSARSCRVQKSSVDRHALVGDVSGDQHPRQFVWCAVSRPRGESFHTISVSPLRANSSASLQGRAVCNRTRHLLGENLCAPGFGQPVALQGKVLVYGKTVETLRVRGIGFRSLTGALDTTTAQGRLVFHMFSALAEFERSLIRERTQAGLAAARRAGRTGGRPPKLTDETSRPAKAMLANPDIGVTQIAHRLGVSPATLYRYIPAARTANAPGV